MIARGLGGSNLTSDEDAKAAGLFGAYLSQVLIEALVATGKLSLEDAVNVLVQVREMAKTGGDPEHDRVVEAARLIETGFRKRLAEAEGHRSN
jgi:hypothetical protein